VIIYRQRLCRTGKRGREGQRSGREIKKLKDEFIKKQDQLRNDMNIISSISVTDIVLMIIWGNEIIELFPK